MKVWLSKKQVSEMQIGRWNRKAWRKRPRNKSSGVSTQTVIHASEMRANPTPSEARLLHAMRKVRYERGWVLSSQTVLRPYIVDIFIPNRKVVVEVDGDSHVGREDYDSRRDSFLFGSGWSVIRVSNEEVWADIEATVANIADFVDTYGKKWKGWKKHARV